MATVRLKKHGMWTAIVAAFAIVVVDGCYRQLPGYTQTGELSEETSPLPPVRSWREDLLEVTDAQYAALDGLAPGSREAQELQRQVVQESVLPLEVVTAKARIAFRLIPAGSFVMGSPRGEKGRPLLGESPHEVVLTTAFYCGKFEVTQGQWEQVVGSFPFGFKKWGKDAPMSNVDWDDCRAFAEKLCQLEGVSEGTYRLLTEAEWEYACRAGTRTRFCYGDSLNMGTANYGHRRTSIMKVGSFPCNGWGVYDMHGNVWEWCQDWLADYPSHSVTDPVGPRGGLLEALNGVRVCRGGSYDYTSKYCRSAYRMPNVPSWSSVSQLSGELGFRLARTIPSIHQ